MVLIVFDDKGDDKQKTAELLTALQKAGIKTE